MEKFRGGILPAVGHVGKVGEADHAWAVGSWSPGLWAEVESKWVHRCEEEFCAGRMQEEGRPSLGRQFPAPTGAQGVRCSDGQSLRLA